MLFWIILGICLLVWLFLAYEAGDRIKEPTLLLFAVAVLALLELFGATSVISVIGWALAVFVGYKLIGAVSDMIRQRIKAEVSEQITARTQKN